MNAKGNDGATPLHWAAENGMDRIAALLLDKGADINAEDNQGETPLDRANKKGHNAVASLLKGRGGGSAVAARRERERQEAERAKAQRAAAAERARQASSSDSGGGLLRGALGLGLGALAGKGLYDQTGDAEAAGRLAGEVMTGVMGLTPDSGGGDVTGSYTRPSNRPTTPDSGSGSTGGSGSAAAGACEPESHQDADLARIDQLRAAGRMEGVAKNCCVKAIITNHLHDILKKCGEHENARKNAEFTRQSLKCATQAGGRSFNSVADCRPFVGL